MRWACGCSPGPGTTTPAARSGSPGGQHSSPRCCASPAGTHLRRGKWHLLPADSQGPAGPYGDWPLARGFNRFYGFLGGAADHYYPELVRDNHHIEPPARPEDGYHLTDDLIDRSSRFVSDHIAHRPWDPLFLYLPLGAAHAPHHAPPNYMERVRGRFDAGWDRIRENRYERQLEAGIIPPGTELPPSNPDVRPWAEPHLGGASGIGAPAGGLRRLHRAHRHCARTPVRPPETGGPLGQHAHLRVFGQRRGHGRPRSRGLRAHTLLQRHRARGGGTSSIGSTRSEVLQPTLSTQGVGHKPPTHLSGGTSATPTAEASGFR